MRDLESKKSKVRIENKLISLGIKDIQVSYLPDNLIENYQTPYEVGCRLLIFIGITYSAHNINERPLVVDWLKKEGIWSKVSNKEVEFLIKTSPNESELVDFSWRVEGALVLAWVLNLLDKLKSIDSLETDEFTDEEIKIFTTKIPQIGDKTNHFLSNLTFRNLDEIFEENILNELSTTYFRNLIFNGENDDTKINRIVSFERHLTLNWVRQFSEISNWDDTDTST